MAYRNKEKERETRRRYYWKHLEEERKRGRERKRRYRAAKREEINARQRARYREKSASELPKIYANRVRRQPWRGIRAAVQAYERGDLPIGELTKLIDNRLSLTDEANREANRKRRTPGCGRGYGRVRDSKRDRRLSKNKVSDDATTARHNKSKEETCQDQTKQMNRS